MNRRTRRQRFRFLNPLYFWSQKNEWNLNYIIECDGNAKLHSVGLQAQHSLWQELDSDIYVKIHNS